MSWQHLEDEVRDMFSLCSSCFDMRAMTGADRQFGVWNPEKEAATACEYNADYWLRNKDSINAKRRSDPLARRRALLACHEYRARKRAEKAAA